MLCYQLILIPLKLYVCLSHAVQMCISFGYNPQINFVTFFVRTEKITSNFYSQSKWMVLCVNSFSYSFMPIPLKLYMRLVHGLKMCVSFGYNPQIIFVTVSQVELSHLNDQSEWIQGVLCWNSSYSFMSTPLKLYRCLGHGLKICILLGYTPQIISPLLPISLKIVQFLLKSPQNKPVLPKSFLSVGLNSHT